MMKKMMMMLMLVMAATVMTAKDIRTLVVTTTPQMHCKNCENRVKNNLKPVKGIKSVETSVADQTVTIQYDAKKTSEEALMAAFDTFGYKVRKLAEGEKIVKEAHECKEKEGMGDCKE
jgi:copper chaperone CopZ